MTMRWNRSRWVPSAWATAALMGSAWDTATTTPPGCLAAQPCDGVHDAGLHVGEALAAREPEPARVALDRPPLGQLHQRLQLAAGPLAEVALEQPSLGLHLQAARRADRRRRLLGALQRRGVDRVDPLQLGDPLRRRLGLGPALVGEVQPGRPARAGPCPWSGSGRGGRTGRRWGVAVVRRAMVGTPTYRRRRGLARIGRGRHRRLPGLPAPGGLARAGGPRQAGRLPRRGVLGPAGARLRRPRRQGAGGRPGAGRPRRQPHRAGVHRRPVGRLAVPRHVPRRPGQPAHEHSTATTAWCSPAPTSRPPCGAPRRPTSPRPTSATAAGPTSCASSRCSAISG